MSWFASPGEVTERSATGYLADPATRPPLSRGAEKPLLVEGRPGGQDRARQVDPRDRRDLVRLQCYEGLDEARALYEWNYKKQLLRIQACR